jgi:hypothetical protein
MKRLREKEKKMQEVLVTPENVIYTRDDLYAYMECVHDL